MNSNFLEDMRSSSIVVLASGAVGIVAFFLPWHVAPNGISLLGSALQSGSASAQALFPGGFILAWIEVIAAVALIASPFLVSSKRKLADLLALAGGVLGVLFLLYVFVTALVAVGNGNAAAAGRNVFLLLGVGFWIAFVGFISGVLGAYAGLKEPAGSVERAQWPAEMVSTSASKE
jgi:hypothetical protein